MIGERTPFRFTRRGFVTVLIGSTASLFVFRPASSATDILVARGIDRFRITEQGSTRIIEGVDVSLSSDLAPATHDLLVRGDYVKLLGTIAIPGRTVTIVARVLECAEGASIVTAGGVGQPDYSGLIAPPGQSGAGDAGKGQDGGSILILAGEASGTVSLEASGGSGGAAQSGGDGLPGAVGSPADSARPGGKGGAGQPGGAAGKPGDGGDAGTIRLSVIKGTAELSLSGTVEGGAPGTPGKHGKSGEAGPGGPPASGTIRNRFRCEN